MHQARLCFKSWIVYGDVILKLVSTTYAFYPEVILMLPLFEVLKMCLHQQVHVMVASTVNNQSSNICSLRSCSANVSFQNVLFSFKDNMCSSALSQGSVFHFVSIIFFFVESLKFSMPEAHRASVCNYKVIFLLIKRKKRQKKNLLTLFYHAFINHIRFIAIIFYNLICQISVLVRLL